MHGVLFGGQSSLPETDHCSPANARPRVGLAAPGLLSHTVGHSCSVLLELSTQSSKVGGNRLQQEFSRASRLRASALGWLVRLQPVRAVQPQSLDRSNVRLSLFWISLEFGFYKFFSHVFKVYSKVFWCMKCLMQSREITHPSPQMAPPLCVWNEKQTPKVHALC